MSTTLNNRILWADGDTTFTDYEGLCRYLLSGAPLDGIFIEAVTPEIKKYNSLTLDEDDELQVKGEVLLPQKKWSLPEKYKKIDLSQFLIVRLSEELGGTPDEKNSHHMERVERVVNEVELWQKRKLLDLLRTLIYIVDTFEENNVVWGTGRGSSCASYILYLIGVHEVDSVEYELDIGEFFR